MERYKATPQLEKLQILRDAKRAISSDELANAAESANSPSYPDRLAIAQQLLSY